MDGTAGVQSGIAKSKVPTKMRDGPKPPTKRVLDVDRAMREMPEDMRYSIECSRVYSLSKGDRCERFKAKTEHSTRMYYSILNEAYMFVAGRLGIIL